MADPAEAEVTEQSAVEAPAETDANTQAEGAGATGDSATPAATAEPTAGAQPEQDDRSPAARRIDEITRQKWEAIRRAEAAEAAAQEAARTLEEIRRANAQAQADGAPQPQGNFTQQDLQAQALAYAETMRFNEACNGVAQKGQSKYPDFNRSVEALGRFGAAYSRDFIEAAMETGKAEDLLYELGRNPAEADRIMSLRGSRQAIALAKFADSIGATNGLGAAAVSRAPAPIKPAVGGTGRGEPSLYDENLSMDDWMRLRNKQVGAR